MKTLSKCCVGLFVGVIVTGCSMANSSDATEHIGTTKEKIDELNCAFRAVSTPTSGATFSSVSLSDCVGTNTTSPNSSYGYTNCTNAYIVDFLSIADNDSPSSFADRAKFDLLVSPDDAPPTQSACEDTKIKFYVYGTDADETLWNYGPVDESGDPLGLTATGTWVIGGGPFNPSHCEYNGSEEGILRTVDLNSFDDDFSGRIESVRVIAQVTNLAGTTRAPVRVHIDAALWTFPSDCVSR